MVETIETVDALKTSGAELEPVRDRTLFGVSDPVDVIGEAKRVATALKAELKAGDMVKRIGNREYVLLEGWQTLATMLGIVGVNVWSRPLENGWEARAEARTLDGRVVGAAEAMCTRAERNWARRDDFAVRSMAQTRALSKALRSPLGFTMTLAGHPAIPAEEADAETTEPPPVAWARPAPVKSTAEALVLILQAAGVEPRARHAREIGQRVFDGCDKTVPACVLAVLQDLAGTIAGTTPGASDSEVGE
jgi:hypothetical protein